MLRTVGIIGFQWLSQCWYALSNCSGPRLAATIASACFMVRQSNRQIDVGHLRPLNQADSSATPASEVVLSNKRIIRRSGNSSTTIHLSSGSHDPFGCGFRRLHAGLVGGALIADGRWCRHAGT